MNPLRALAYRNSLHKAPCVYYLRVQKLDTLRVEDIVARIGSPGFAIDNRTYTFLVNRFLDECIAATCEGFSVCTDLFQSSLIIKGTYAYPDLWRTFRPGSIPISFHLIPGQAARQSCARLAIQSCGPAEPKPRAVTASAPALKAGSAPKGGP